MLTTFQTYTDQYFKLGIINPNYFRPVAAKLLGVDPDPGARRISPDSRAELDDVILDETGTILVDAASRARTVYRRVLKRLTPDELRDETILHPVVEQTYDDELAAIALAQPSRPTLPPEMQSALSAMVGAMLADHVAHEDRRVAEYEAQLEIERITKSRRAAKNVLERHIDPERPETIIDALPDAQEGETMQRLLNEGHVITNYVYLIFNNAVNALARCSTNPANASEDEIRAAIRKGVQETFLDIIIHAGAGLLITDKIDHVAQTRFNEDPSAYGRIVAELPITLEPTTQQIEDAIAAAFPNGLKDETNTSTP